MRSGKRTRRPLRKTTSMINDGGASGITAGAGNATWSAISTAAKHACGPGVIDRISLRYVHKLFAERESSCLEFIYSLRVQFGSDSHPASSRPSPCISNPTGPSLQGASNS
jgi:hypothetical protein